jgi:hypothetical protein
MREDAAVALLERAGADRSVLEGLVAEELLRPIAYQGKTFYLRRLGAGAP